MNTLKFKIQVNNAAADSLLKSLQIDLIKENIPRDKVENRINLTKGGHLGFSEVLEALKIIKI